MNGKRRLFTLLKCIVALLLLLSCSFFGENSPVQTGPTQDEAALSNPVAQDSESEQGILIPDPAAGLDALTGYTAFLQQDATGTIDGQPYESHTRVSVSRVAHTGDYDYVLEQDGSQVRGSYTRILGQDGATYRWTAADEQCQVAQQAPQDGEMVEPAALLPGIPSAEQVGTETVNQIACVHYRFDQADLGLTDGTQVSGEVWVAQEGGYIVKYVYSAPLPAEVSGSGLEIAQTWTYELTLLDGEPGIALPEDCPAVLTGIPVFPRGEEAEFGPGWMEFTTASPSNEVLQYYQAELADLGWALMEELPEGEPALPFTASFSQGDEILTLSLLEDEQGGMTVTIDVMAEQPLDDQPTVSETPSGTPTPAPTIDAAQSGLPEDIPLYPGATDLMTINEMIMFRTSDTLDSATSYYLQQMPENGWTLLNQTTTANAAVQEWEKSGRSYSLAFSASDGQTLITVINQ